MTPTSRFSRMGLALFAAFALFPACSVHDPALSDAGRFGGDAALSLDAPFDSPDSGPLSDPEIVGVLRAVHDGDVAVTRYVAATSVRADVVAWALDLTAQHEAAQASLSATGITGVPSAISARQASLRMQELEALRSETCASRDARYLGFQSLVSGEVVALVEHNLLPAVTSPALRTEIETTRTIVMAQYAGLPVADGAIPEAAMPNWEAGPLFDSGCPSTEIDATIDVGPDS